MKASRQTTISVVIIIAVIIATAAVLLVGGEPEPKQPKTLPTEFPRETVSLPERPKATNIPSYSPGAVLVQIQALGETCWGGEINDTRVDDCGAKEYVLIGPPGTGNLFSVTIRKKETDRKPLTLALSINGQVVDIADTKRPLGLVAVTGN